MKFDNINPNSSDSLKSDWLEAFNEWLDTGALDKSPFVLRQKMDEGVEQFIDAPRQAYKMWQNKRQMQAAIGHNIDLMLSIAGRYADEEGKLIGSRTLGQMPLRALYSFMRGPMKLDDHDIDTVLSRYGKLKNTSMPNIDLNAASLAGDNRMQDAWESASGSVGLDRKQAMDIIRKMVGVATMYRQEKMRMGSDGAPRQAAAADEPTKAAQWQEGDPISVAGKTITKDDPNYQSVSAAYQNLVDLATAPAKSQ